MGMVLIIGSVVSRVGAETKAVYEVNQNFTLSLEIKLAVYTN